MARPDPARRVRRLAGGAGTGHLPAVQRLCDPDRCAGHGVQLPAQHRGMGELAGQPPARTGTGPGGRYTHLCGHGVRHQERSQQRMSMTDKELVLQVLQDYSRDKAAALQADQVNTTGTELDAQEQYIPDFQAAKAAMNMSQRKVGENDGFLCRSTAGHVVRLIGSYDSDVWPGEPEELPAQWKFVWSKDPKKARPFVAI